MTEGKKMGRPITPRELTGDPRRDIVILALNTTGWSLERLGEEIGVKKQTISNWLAGVHQPPPAPLKLAMIVLEKFGRREDIEAAREFWAGVK